MSIVVNAGSNKNSYKLQAIKVFLDCLLLSIGSDITNVYYKVIGEIDSWTEISIGNYSSLLDATRSFTYFFNNEGTLNVQLKAINEALEESEDSLNVTVTEYKKVVLPYIGYITKTINGS